MQRTAIAILASGLLILLLLAPAGAENPVEDMEISLDVGFAFGRGVYEDEDENSFEADLTGYRLKAAGTIMENVVVGGSYLSLGDEEALSLRVNDEGDTVEGSLNNSQIDIAVLYKLWPEPSLALGGGWTGYTFTVTGPEEYVYTAERNYRGFKLAGAAEMEVIEDLKAGASLSYAPSLSVSDTVVGAWKEPERTAESSYSGSLLDLNVEAAYRVYEMVHVEIGYQFTKLTGEGESDHPEYRFLEHAYNTNTFRLGLGASF